ncbi:hypothetical protein AGDE_16416 [Angomonas deanei]|uniref:Uncharacterized protein n=1 Tax=Angomonas deanei TaxID=59799 RepID=A0A7G2CPF8_9TRYP|nr:hypothetical protein AGDE_16416 [Angomonas deanei]CAD2220987.1 hypothetical protein, conserved [Angomonas deanei]|eukprot:EPY17115.1 hypothetical protein AGDE_16416 [Angomonas deanei]
MIENFLATSGCTGPIHFADGTTRPASQCVVEPLLCIDCPGRVAMYDKNTFKFTFYDSCQFEHNGNNNGAFHGGTAGCAAVVGGADDHGTVF